MVPTVERGLCEVDFCSMEIYDYLRLLFARSGGDVWTKSMPKGQTAAVRVDPAVVRNPPRGFADEVPHAHKEIVPTSEVGRRGNYDGSRATTLDDTAVKTNDPARTHIPIQE